MHLDDKEFYDNPDLSKQQNIDYRKDVITDHIEELKNMFYRQLSKCRKWEIYLKVESKMNIESKVFIDN